MEPDDPDPDRTGAFGEQLLGMLTGGMLTMRIGIGYRTGLFEAATRGPATSDELAERAGLHERYVREWLGAIATGGSGLGAMWGRERAGAMLADAGFTDVRVLDTPRPQNCMYVCRTEAS